MVHRSKRKALSALLAVSALGACTNPYAMKSSGLNYRAPQGPGSIQFTDPKLYRREALISERDDEVKYLNQLLTDSTDKEKLVFAPEIMRELEVVTALSASLGLRFDPAAATNYRRTEETSEIQHEIQTMKLQLQLDQLKRDAELYRKSLAANETAPTANPGGTDPGTAGTLASPTESPPSVTALVDAITSLTNELKTQQRANLTALSASGGKVSPFDDFQDRSAYRNLVTSARNAASLDELHDRDGAALIRLYFSATVLPPDQQHLDTLGMLRMEVGPPDWTEDDLQEAYLDWLSYVNANLNIRNQEQGKAAPDYSVNPAFSGIAATEELFDTGYFNYPRTDLKAGCNGIARRDAATEAGSPKGKAAAAQCGSLMIALPRPAAVLGRAQDKAFDIAEELHLGSDMYSAAFRETLQELRSPRGANLAAGCDAGAGSRLAAFRTQSGIDGSMALSLAFKTYFLTPALTQADQHARKLLTDQGLRQPDRSELLVSMIQLNVHAGPLIEEFSRVAVRQGCSGFAFGIGDSIKAYVPRRFAAVVMKPDARVAVYDVGPTEQAQQVSTAARASEAISLAAAVAGKVPTQGLGMDGNLAYSRSAMGRADARERVPLVVSFAEPGSSQVVDRCTAAGREKARGKDKGKDRGEAKAATPAGKPCVEEIRQMPAFGWMLGPRMTVDPVKQRMVLEQQLKPYELSVDLTVPGWWPYLYLTSRTAWAPNWRQGNTRSLTEGPDRRTVKVRLSPNSADYGALTSILAGDSAVRLASITDVYPRRISACSAQTEVQISGQNIWRVKEAIVGGRRYDDSTKLKMLPDMSGIVLQLDGGPYPALEDKDKLPLTLLTPYGRATTRLTVVDAKADGSCARAAAKAGGKGK